MSCSAEQTVTVHAVCYNQYKYGQVSLRCRGPKRTLSVALAADQVVLMTTGSAVLTCRQAAAVLLLPERSLASLLQADWLVECSLSSTALDRYTMFISTSQVRPVAPQLLRLTSKT